MRKPSLRKLALVFAAVLVPSASQAELRSIDHDFSHARLQIGDGLPVPITNAPTYPTTATNPFSPPFAEGPVRAKNDKAITQNTAAGQTANTALPSGRSIVLPSGLLTIEGVTLPNTPYVHDAGSTTDRRVRGVFLQNSAVFEVETRLEVKFPITMKKTAQTPSPASTTAPHTFAVGGRTGSPTMSVCADTGSPNNYNPSCLGPGGTTPTNPSTINGLMVYTKTKNQFGGPAHGIIKGRATVWAQAAGAPPCHFTSDPPCQALVVYAHPGGGRNKNAPFSTIPGSLFGTVAAGGPFGFQNTTPGAPNPSPQAWGVGVTTSGLITDRLAGVGGALTNAATSFGGPFTTGRLTVQVTSGVMGESETFMLTGSDQRGEGGNGPGSGAIMLVAGAVSARVASGSNANRAWVALTVPEPGATLGAAGALLALLVGHGVARRRGR